MLAAISPSDDLRRLEARMLERLRAALRDQPLLHWADDEFAAFFALFDPFDLVRLEEGGTTDRMADGAIYACDLSGMLRLHARRPTRHVLLTPLNENWGAFSTTVPHRTIDWGRWDDLLALAGCTRTQVLRYLDDPAVKAVVATSHTALSHPKIVSLPIGIAVEPAQLLPLIHGGRPDKTELLLLNNSGWGHRAAINARVIANFGGALANTYHPHQPDYLPSIVRSRFVLCPSGFGWDTYRLWETLMLGSIPVVEYSEGWHTVLDDLPVLFVTNFDEVTPALLARAYPAILANVECFDFAKLTTPWWAAMIMRRLV
jgi:hypothetical protein